MADRQYYVRCKTGCLAEAMTKEETLAAIKQAIETGEIKDVDTGFITKIKEQNAAQGLAFWVGTTAEYNALETKTDSCFYIITDDTSAEDLDAFIKEILADLEGKASISYVNEKVKDFATTKMAFGRYFGTGVIGKENKNVLQFDFEPKVVFLFDDGESDFVPLPPAVWRDCIDTLKFLGYYKFNYGAVLIGEVTAATDGVFTFSWYVPAASNYWCERSTEREDGAIVGDGMIVRGNTALFDFPAFQYNADGRTYYYLAFGI
jgi:hypothetical protein